MFLSEWNAAVHVILGCVANSYADPLERTRLTEKDDATERPGRK